MLEEVENDIERSSMKVVEWNLCLDLRHFFGFSNRPGNFRLHQYSFIEAWGFFHETGHYIACVLSVYAACCILLVKGNLVLVRQPIFLYFVSNLHNLNPTIDFSENANISPGNSLFLGIISTSFNFNLILTICAIFKLKESRAPGALGSDIAKSWW